MQNFTISSMSHEAAKKIENEALMQWKDGFLKATSKVIAITFDGCTGLVSACLGHTLYNSQHLF